MFSRFLEQTRDRAARTKGLTLAAELIDRGILLTTARTCLGPLTAETLLQAHVALDAHHKVCKRLLSRFS